MKNIILFGGSGFIGSNIIKYSKHNFYSFTKNYDLNSTNINYIIIESYSKIDFNNYFIDIDINEIWFLGGNLSPNTDKKQFMDYFIEEICLFKNIINYFSNKIEKIVFLSTGGVMYSKINSKNSYQEDEIRSTNNLYQSYKVFVENLINSNFKDDQVLILRPSNIYGRKLHYKRLGLVEYLIKSSHDSSKIKLFDNGTHFDFLHIRNFVKIFMFFTNNNINGTYNVGSGYKYNINEVLRVFKRFMIIDFEIVYLKESFINPPSIKKMKRLMKKYKFNHPSMNLHEGIKDILNR